MVVKRERWLPGWCNGRSGERPRDLAAVCIRRRRRRNMDGVQNLCIETHDELMAGDGKLK